MKRLVLALATVGLLGGCSLFDRRPPPDHADRRPAHPGARRPRRRSRPTRRSPTIPVSVPPARPPTRIGRSRAATPPSRWAMSRSAIRRRGRGASASATATASAPGSSPSRWSAAGRVYTIDTKARVRAFDLQTGAQVWEHQLRGENSPSRGAVRRRRHLRQRPGLCDQRRRRCGRARRGDRQPASGW